MSLWSQVAKVREIVFWIQMKAIHGCDASVVFVQGRDITTFLCRNSLLRFFITCDLDEKSKRISIKNGLSVEKNAERLSNRDHEDSTRKLRRVYFDKEGGVRELPNSGDNPNIAISQLINVVKPVVLEWQKEIITPKIEEPRKRRSTFSC